VINKKRNEIDIKYHVDKGCGLCFYIYVLVANDFGDFYIGQTDNITKRSIQHISSIVSCFSGRTDNCLPFHEKLSRKVPKYYKLNDKKLMFKFISSMFTINVIDIAVSREVATEKEKYYISTNIGNSFLLNNKIPKR
jgi:hypothetical protein